MILTEPLYTLNSEVFSEHQIGVNLHYFGVNR